MVTDHDLNCRTFWNRQLSGVSNKLGVASGPGRERPRGQSKEDSGAVKILCKTVEVDTGYSPCVKTHRTEDNK